MKYILIHNLDGDTYVTEYDRETLLKELDGGEWPSEDFLDTVPTSRDTNYWQGKFLLIKGEVVQPKKKEVVTKHDL